MRNLNEQWIEVIDGQEHMMKAVKAVIGGSCQGCFYNNDYGVCASGNFQDCCQGSDIIVKDLGILRLKDGVLPCPFCGEYPEVSYADEYVEISCENMECKIASMTLEDKRLQQAIDAWNRRD